MFTLNTATVKRISYFILEFIDCDRSNVEFAGESLVLFFEFTDLAVEVRTLLFPFCSLLLLTSIIQVSETAYTKVTRRELKFRSSTRITFDPKHM